MKCLECGLVSLMGVRLFLPAFVRARAHVSVFSLREKVEDAGGCSVKSLSSGVAGERFCLLD